MKVLAIFAAAFAVGQAGNCAEKTTKGKNSCERQTECMYVESDYGSMCMDRPLGKDGKYVWGNTQSPDYWANCVATWCNKHVWHGGIEMCHWEPEYGCGCEAMDKDECLADDTCYYASQKLGCREKISCKELHFHECIEYSDKCQVCNGGCAEKCKLGPGQEIKGLVNVMMDSNTCTCMIENVY